jgi:branched-chain amino acid transport system ATP-binding protein
MGELLRVEGLRKCFGELLAVDGVDLNLEAGVLTSIIGPNGAGKTTLINLLTGSISPDSGKVFFRGVDITKMPTDKRVRRGICRSFQVMNIFHRLTVFKNVQLPVLSVLNKTLKPFSRLDDHRDAVAEVEEILKEVGLWEQKDLLAGQLSHGHQRLLEMSMAIAAKPELCLLDEPTSGMNPVEKVEVLELIKRLSATRKATFLIVEHDMDVVFSLSARIVVMNRGSIIADGEPAQIRENQEVKDAYLGEEVEL